MRRPAATFVAGITLALGGCALGSAPARMHGDAPVFVAASAETRVDTDPTVDADDPAFWADPADPARAVLFGTDKTDGLYVHNLDGSVRQLLASGPLNNVDLRGGYSVGGRSDWVLVAATNDGRMGINTYLFDPRTLETRDYGFVATDIGAPYGFCMGRRADGFYLVADTKGGAVHIWRIADRDGAPQVEKLRTLQLSSQLEGCVVDDEADALYVGEEDVAIWRFDFDPAATAVPTRMAAVDGHRITADVEGLTILRDGANRYLVASSQGDSTYPVFRITPAGESYIGRFAIGARDGIDGVTATDGLDGWSGPIGRYPEGALAFHDDRDDPNPGQQNFKIVDWRAIKAALKLP